MGPENGPANSRPSGKPVHFRVPKTDLVFLRNSLRTTNQHKYNREPRKGTQNHRCQQSESVARQLRTAATLVSKTFQRKPGLLGLWKDPPSHASKDPSFQRSPQFKGFAPETLQRSGSKEPGPLGGWVSGCDSKPPSPLEAQLHSHPEGRPKSHLAQPQTPPEVLQNPP